jgi:hypothetical protein
MADWKHPNDMDREELRELVSAMGMMALDLAQHIAFTNDMLKPELRAEAYKRGEAMAYELAHYPMDGPREDSPRTPGIAVFGEGGLQAWT